MTFSEIPPQIKYTYALFVMPTAADRMRARMPIANIDVVTTDKINCIIQPNFDTWYTVAPLRV
ncbi:MAG: hypothetical protein OSA51_10860 [Octadecabacter sp.]|nr:hypothetical protein [Octadecabacter sp.]